MLSLLGCGQKPACLSDCVVRDEAEACCSRSFSTIEAAYLECVGGAYGVGCASTIDAVDDGWVVWSFTPCQTASVSDAVLRWVHVDVDGIVTNVGFDRVLFEECPPDGGWVVLSDPGVPGLQAD